MFRIDDAAKKRTTDLALNGTVLDATRTMERPRRCWQDWNADNRRAVLAYNERVDAKGLPLARYRSFMMGR